MDNSAMLVARIALSALAVAACAWFALGTVQARDEDRATALLALPGTPTAAETATILRLLSTAGTLNPDRQIELLRVQAEQRAGESAAALRTALAVTHAEPENAFAWVELGYAASRDSALRKSATVRDLALVRLAAVRERELAPPVPDGP